MAQVGEQMRQWLIILSAAVVLVAAFLVYQEFQIRQLSANTQFERNKECSVASERRFKALGWDEKGGMVGGFTASYSNHYNQPLNKCLMFLNIIGVDLSAKTSSLDESVIDVFEGQTYAEFQSTTNDNAVSKIGSCIITIPGQSQRTCASEAEWRSLIKPLMESTNQ